MVPLRLDPKPVRWVAPAVLMLGAVALFRSPAAPDPSAADGLSRLPVDVAVRLEPTPSFAGAVSATRPPTGGLSSATSPSAVAMVPALAVALPHVVVPHSERQQLVSAATPSDAEPSLELRSPHDGVRRLPNPEAVENFRRDEAARVAPSVGGKESETPRLPPPATPRRLPPIEHLERPLPAPEAASTRSTPAPAQPSPSPSELSSVLRPRHAAPTALAPPAAPTEPRLPTTAAQPSVIRRAREISLPPPPAAISSLPPVQTPTTPRTDIIEALPHLSAAALREQVRRRVTIAGELAQRGAYYSAKREFEQALRFVAESRDVAGIGSGHSAALSAAFAAIEEADEFFVDDPRSSNQLDVHNVVVAHRTPVLRNGAARDLTPMQAMQTYYGYAQTKLAEALGQERSAADALYGLGRVYEILARESSPAARLAGPKVMLMHQAALTVDPGHAVAANELGVLLARFGHLPEAKEVLLRSRLEERSPELWHNLAVVHQRLGEMELAQLAHHEQLTAIQRQQSTAQPAVVMDPETGLPWVDVSALARAQPAPGEAQTPQAESSQATSWWPWKSSHK